jgi:hypothetical protein
MIKLAPSPDEFYDLHRGGSGNVFIVEGFVDGEREHCAVFGSIEAAETYMSSFRDDDLVWVTVPYRVDDPWWGDRKTN